MMIIITELRCIETVMDATSGALTEEAGSGQHGLRGRAIISRQHRQLLEGAYARNPRPTTTDLDRVAGQMTGVPRRVVRVWFQNKRARDRRRGRRSVSESSSGSAKSPVSLNVSSLYFVIVLFVSVNIYLA